MPVLDRITETTEEYKELSKISEVEVESFDIYDYESKVKQS
jgi:hypothetical protein